MWLAISNHEVSLEQQSEQRINDKIHAPVLNWNSTACEVWELIALGRFMYYCSNVVT